MTRVIQADQRGPRVVPAQLADAGERVRSLLADARTRAQAIVAAAETRVAVAEQQARERGRAQAQAEVRERLDQLDHARAQLVTNSEPQLIALAVAAAQHIVGAELTLRPEAIEGVLRPLLERLRNAHTVTVHVHPDDAQWLQAALPTPPGEADTPARLRFHADIEIARGGCLVVSDIGALDARVETRLSVLEDALKRSVRQDGR